MDKINANGKISVIQIIDLVPIKVRKKCEKRRKTWLPAFYWLLTFCPIPVLKRLFCQAHKIVSFGKEFIVWREGGGGKQG